MTTTAIHLDEKAYGQLLRRTLPHVIHSDEECARLTDELVRLDELEKPSREEKELAELLTILIEVYEEQRYPIRKSNPRQVLHHLMEARNVLRRIFGSSSDPKALLQRCFMVSGLSARLTRRNSLNSST